ncbi:DUF1513 domain-containing protein [Marinibaculum pumilum]|uniref:DUF1513 domain-containing protein n=1 Tax=Marinibaculum pumilum TaxID=1766165 RepID=A0ABV7KV93_9PROT
MTATEPDGAAASSRIDRRRLLAGAMACGALAVTQLPRRSTAAPALPRFAATAAAPDGGFALCLIDGDGRISLQLALPGRGHGFAWHAASGRLTAFARRPDRFAVALDGADVAALRFDAPEGRHFYGHGVYSPDGSILYACENDYDGARGVIGLYDATAGYARLGEMESGAIGPHQIDWLPDGRTLVVANGGIETHPDYGRTKLNLPTMEPSVALLDSRSGRLAAQDALPAKLHQLSLRHLAVDARGRAWIGGQYEGPKTDLPPLVSVFDPATGRLAALEMPPALSARYRTYIGSVMASGDGRLVATSSPRGSIVTLWDIATLQPLAHHAIEDVCGLAAWGDGFLATGGGGDLVHLTRAGAEPVGRHPLHWDNHALAL